MANNTWSGLTPQQDQIWESLYDKYVPAMGMAETIGGEILRAMSRILYRFYNDGDMVGVGYGNETCNSSDRYLDKLVPFYTSLDDGYNESTEAEYEAHMLKNHRVVFIFLQKYSDQLFTMENTSDSREVSEEDYQREREYEMDADDWYDEEDC